MMGLGFPKAHKAIVEAKAREHPSDVDLRYIIIGFGLVAFIFGSIFTENASISAGSRNEELLLTAASIAMFLLIPYLYALAKLCRRYPRGSRWVIFYSSLVASAAYLLLIFFRPEIIVAGILMLLYLLTVSFVSIRQIYKYHRQEIDSKVPEHE